MKQLVKLTSIGVLAGIILASMLIVLHILTDNLAYVLLFNVDYLPVLQDLRPHAVIGVMFHFAFCIVSVVGLFYILKMIDRERQTLLYIIVYTIGSAILYFLTSFSTKPPFVNDLSAWLSWTFSHAIYGFIVGLFTKRWV